MKCEICGLGPAEEQGGITVYRVNEKGVKGIWRCEKCLTPEQRAKIDPEAWRLTEILEGRKPEK